MARPQNLETRERLIRAGTELINRNGFNGCGVQDITAAAKIPKGSFYNYFDSKETFAVSILDEYWSTIKSNYGSILEDQTLAPVKRVQDHFSELVAYHGRQKYVIGCLIGNLAVELTAQSAVIREKLKSIFGVWNELIANCLSAARKQGDMESPAAPRELAASLIEAFEGAVLASKVAQNGKALKRFETLVLPALLA